jgi:hypothetical protein
MTDFRLAVAKTQQAAGNEPPNNSKARFFGFASEWHLIGVVILNEVKDLILNESHSYR